MDSAVKASLLLSLLACASAQSPCDFEGKFCDPESSQTEIWEMPTANLPASTLDEAAAECYAECNAGPVRDPPCEAFTVIKTGRRPPSCHLILEACVENIVDECIDLGNCKSGPSDCADPPVTCPVVAALPADEGFVRWQCVDINYQPINPYVDAPPEGTICFQTCPSWKSEDDSSARLTSECKDVAGEGAWSEVQNYDGVAMAYPPYKESETSYPTPDVIDKAVALTCGCPDLELKWPYEDEAGVWYDPNTEEAAEFICNTPVVEVGGEYRIETDNTCVLYCDDHYVATAKCLNGAWSGNPEWGFWCYEEP